MEAPGLWREDSIGGGYPCLSDSGCLARSFGGRNLAGIGQAFIQKPVRAWTLSIAAGGLLPGVILMGLLRAFNGPVPG